MISVSVVSEKDSGASCRLNFPFIHVSVEFATLQLSASGKVIYKIFKPAEIEQLLKDEGVATAPAAEGATATEATPVQ